MFEVPGGLRPHLQVEFSYTQPKINVEIRSIKSFVNELSGNEPEAEIQCLVPIETAADKLCALTWRVNRRNRDDELDDPALIRHLHDLGALYPIILSEPRQFAETAFASFQVDMRSTSRGLDNDLPGAARHALNKLRSDSIYAFEYQQFVMNMSYAKDNEQINFDTALVHMQDVIGALEP